ncbi:MAG TPA: TM0106 family RecB-like putative nuclease [Marmoricola sp.]|jgi:uncharacterized protein|nr:TM0106 family RecB-like putative nuclease [Marmoricola sp.]
MFLIGADLHWSASDLTAAAGCEYAVLRTLDARLGWIDEETDLAKNPLEEHIARLGDAHEERLRQEYAAAGGLLELAHLQGPHTAERLAELREATLEAFAAEPQMVFQAAFSDGEFFGYADFVERREDGWSVLDAKLARSAKPKALLQLGAYADQLAALGLPLSATVGLLLGTGERVDFPVADVLPAFRERRGRLRELLQEHREEGKPVAWGDDRYVACGRCPECTAAAKKADDLILVAGLRMDQRRRLREAGITTIGALAGATARPESVTEATWDKLCSQARLQWQRMQAGPDAPLTHELTADAATVLALLPAPSPGDLFFDFEGDPLYDEGDPSRAGLEYLWGVLDSDEKYQPAWAHDWAEERVAFEQFVDDLRERRKLHPDLHVYHYAPYETAALKRLAMRYQTREEELDELLRAEVFVDLYATVRGAVRASVASYSIKKLEPLYMGDQLRADDAIQGGDASILEYQEFRMARDDDPVTAEAKLAALADYNEYDCLSTLRLRDWLLERAVEAGVRDRILPRTRAVEVEAEPEPDPVFLALTARSGEKPWAMLAYALDFHRREDKAFWWAHFERLHHQVGEWRDRDVFLVESAEVEQDWAVPEGKSTNARRVLRLTGDWTPGSRPGREAHVVYPAPGPKGAKGPESAPFCASRGDLVADPHDPRVVRVTESRKPEETYPDLPVALGPPAPPDTRVLAEAIHEVASAAAAAPVLPEQAALDLFARRPPRLRGGAPLPQDGTTIDRVVAALTAMDDSYVAVQGPPGTGKSYTGSHVVKRLVEERGWRVGVVGQSHAVVENLLSCVLEAGLDAALVGKKGSQRTDPRWTDLKTGAASAKFLAEHEETGCVLGGTAWTFAASSLGDRPCLDLLVVDEAGQFSLATTLAASVAAKRLLLLGDPQQLPQVSQGTHAEPVDESALGWLMDGHDTIPPELGYFLADSWRMHPDLCAKVSVLSYDGRLASADAATKRSLDGVAPGLAVVRLDHTGNRSESPEEAAEVVAQVQGHLGATWSDPAEHGTPRPLTQDDFLVVAPYNAQVALIRRALDDAGLHDVRVGTVDKFQGQEAPISIVSMTASSHGDVPRGMGFLLNRNRVNVAVSRAKWKAIVIRSQALTAFMPTSTRGVLELGAFVGLCAPGPAD